MHHKNKSRLKEVFRLHLKDQLNQKKAKKSGCLQTLMKTLKGWKAAAKPEEVVEDIKCVEDYHQRSSAGKYDTVHKDRNSYLVPNSKHEM